MLPFVVRYLHPLAKHGMMAKGKGWQIAGKME